MSAQDPSPHYAIAGRESIAQTPELRVTRMTLAEGEATPWHRHSVVADTAFRLDGEVEVQARGPEQAWRLRPGESRRVEPGRVHRVANVGAGPCVFLLVQGVGAYDFIKAED